MVNDEEAPDSGGGFCRFRRVFLSIHCSQPEKIKNKVDELARYKERGSGATVTRLISFRVFDNIFIIIY